jgi:hypothetical protein
MKRARVLAMSGGVALAALAGLGTPSTTSAGCGCDKPPPPRANVRPFVGEVDQKITLFNHLLDSGERYQVRFRNTVDGSVGWSQGRARTKRDIADGRSRVHLRVAVADVGIGPVAISVWEHGREICALGDHEFTVVPEPIVLRDFKASTTRREYQGAVGRDGTLYLPVDVSKVDLATRFTGGAVGFPMAFAPENVAMYNAQGYLMQLLDPTDPQLFDLYPGDFEVSTVLSYWRHEFASYNRLHRSDEDYETEDGEWHSDGTRHVDHDYIVVAIRGTMADGSLPAPGATPPFALLVTSEPEDAQYASNSRSGSWHDDHD